MYTLKIRTLLVKILPLCSILPPLVLLSSSGYAENPTYDDSFVGPPSVHPNNSDSSPTPTSQTIRERILFALSGYDNFPRRVELDKISSPSIIVPLLIDIAQHASKPMHQMRAVDALGYYQSNEITQFLAQLAHGNTPNVSPRLAVSLQHRAIVALARSTKEHCPQLLRDILFGNDLQLQLTTVAAVGKNGGLAGRKMLSELTTGKVNPLVLREAEKFLQ